MTEFKSLENATKRLSSSEPLTDDETRALFRWVLQPAHQFLPRVEIDLALQQIAAINQFNRASGRLTTAAIFVGCAQVAVGLVAVAIAVFK